MKNGRGHFAKFSFSLKISPSSVEGEREREREKQVDLRAGRDRSSSIELLSAVAVRNIVDKTERIVIIIFHQGCAAMYNDIRFLCTNEPAVTTLVPE